MEILLAKPRLRININCMINNTTVSVKVCSGCYWFYATIKGEKICLIAQDENKQIFEKNICVEKIYNKEEALNR